jgi:tricarballylate dehydrogenase
MDLGNHADVLVVGGGNAALCAAIAARRRGASVLLLERASREWRGGNSKYTRNIRCVHGEDPVMPGTYTEDEFWQDLSGVTGDGSDENLARMCIAHSREVPEWLAQNGIRWQPAMRGTLQLGRTNRFFLGGGKALINTLSSTAQALGVRIAYDTMVTGFDVSGGRCTAVKATTASTTALDLHPRAVVLASGGFEANIEWLREYWGDAADNYAIRGARQNDGLPLRAMLDLGAEARGNPRSFHAIAVDARGPRFEGGIVTRVDSVPFSVMVNQHAQRFYDEGEDLWPKRYATWGRLISEQPGQRAWSIFDRKSMGNFMSTAYPPLSAGSIRELAVLLGLDASVLNATVEAYNAAIVPGDFDPAALDGCATSGLTPPKSHWARRIDEPPFYGYPLQPGVTFTYLGVGVDQGARVLRAGETPFQNVYAAGEIMAGNILRHGYLAGFGMTIGTVFGRLAGEAAARHA